MYKKECARTSPCFRLHELQSTAQSTAAPEPSTADSRSPGPPHLGLCPVSLPGQHHSRKWATDAIYELPSLIRIHLPFHCWCNTHHTMLSYSRVHIHVLGMQGPPALCKATRDTHRERESKREKERERLYTLYILQLFHEHTLCLAHTEKYRSLVPLHTVNYLFLYSASWRCNDIWAMPCTYFF